LWSNGQTTQSISVNPTNTGVANIQAPYTVTVTYASGTVSATKNVLVKPIPVITIHNNASNICSGDTCSIYPTSTVVNSTYQWTYSSTNITGASNGSGLAIVHTLNSTTLPIGTILYTITPRYGGCNGIAATTSVTVNTVPTVTFTNNRPGICSGDSTDIQLSSNVSSASFAWTYSPVDIAGAWADSGNYIHQALNATTTGTGMLTYNVTATNNSCSGIAYPVTVNVFPLPVTVVTTNNPVICSGDTALLTLSSVPAGATFSLQEHQTEILILYISNCH
jgi:hypothetical protein